MVFIRKIIIPVFVFSLLVVASCKKGDPDPVVNTDPNPDTVVVRVQSVRDLGALSMPPALVGRDGGQSVLLGGKIIWQFGDSFFNKKGVDSLQYRTNTSAQSTVAAPLATTELLDARGVSALFIPFTAEEKHFNDSTASPTNRIGLWPTGIVTADGNSALVFYTKLHLAATWTDYGIGIAHYTPGQPVTRNADLLFHAPAEPNFQKPFIYNGYLYVYGQLKTKAGAGIGRAPVAHAEDRNAYEFWTGSAWVKDMAATSVILDVPPGSVSYNPYFKMLINVYDEPFNNTAYIRFANSPEGPWSKKQVLYATPPPVTGQNYIINEHPELAKNGGRTITISYSHPLPAFLAGEIRLVEISF